MNLPLGFLHSSNLLHQCHYHCGSLILLPQHSYLSNNIISAFWTCGQLQPCLGRMRSYQLQFRAICCRALDSTWKCDVQISNKTFDSGEPNLFLHVQTLRNFPIEKLHGEVVIVRFDSSLLLEALGFNSNSINRALSTIKYLYNARAKVLLISNWGQSSDSILLSLESVADRLSSLLQIKVVPANVVSNFMQSRTKELEKADILLLDNLTKFREEFANCSAFSEKLSSGAVIFVNDAFSLSHKILASTVGIARFCHASVAGFLFEEEVLQLMKTREITRKPYIAIIGGSSFLEKSNALHLITSVCDGIILVGMLAFQVMHALGHSVPSCFVEYDAVGEALKLIQLARERNIPIYFPNDLWCVNNSNRELWEIFPSNGISTGWTPTDLGPMSVKEIFSLLSKCKKVLWIGPVKFGSFTPDTHGAAELALMLEKISKTGCEVIVVGNAACKAVAGTSSSASYKMFENASVVWEFLKGRTLPGVAALDRAFPFELDWESIFIDPTLPLIVDVGSGNGLFLFQLARKWKNSNFLGLEINNKLVKRCLDIVHESDIKNVYFVSTNATSTFRSIVSSYPGDLILVSIQCPNPDFNREVHRWRMVQRTLVEGIIDLLTINGKVFLQSDIKTVATRMREQFMKYGQGKLVMDMYAEEGWMEGNPFGVPSDWEQHVLDRGAPMYRLMLRKVDDHGTQQKQVISVT